MTSPEKRAEIDPVEFSVFQEKPSLKNDPVGKKKTDKQFFPLFSAKREKALSSDREDEIEEARKKAREIVEEAKQKADELTENAYEKAYAEGEKAGFEYGLKKLEGIIRALADAKQELENLHKEIILSQEQEIISLVLKIARSVIKTESKINDQILSSVIRAALEEVPQKDDLCIKFNPMDYKFIQENLRPFFEEHEELKDAVFDSDSQVDVGGVIVEHKMGSVDARLSRQVEKIEALFQKIMKENLKERSPSS